MPRPIRVQFENAFYHVMNRGLSGQEIFYNNKSYKIFLEILEQCCKRFDVVVHAYCLMSNHYHLLIQTRNANLAKFMQYLAGFYTQRFNKFMDRDGPIFKGRFKSILIQDDSYFLVLGRYIHRNPIVIDKNLVNYKWSSYATYLDLAECPVWLSKDYSLQILSNSSFGNCNYEEFVTTRWSSDKINVNLKGIKGSDPFI